MLVPGVDNRNQLLMSLGFGAIALFLAMVFGILAGLGSVWLAAAISVLTLGSALVFFPYAMTASALVMCLVIVGTFEIFLSFGQANWGASALAGGLIIAAFLARPQLARVQPALSRSWSHNLMLFALWCYFGCMAVSAIINLTPLAQLFVGVRNYIPFLGIFLMLALGRLDERKVKMLVFSVIGVSCIQWLFCIAEQLYVVPKRLVSFAAVGGGAEAIVGSFGGNPLNGGYTGEMAAFVVMALVLCTLLWQAKILPRWVWLLAAVSAGVSVGLAETKIVFVLLPLMVMVIMWRFPGGLNRQIIKLAVVAAVGFTLIAGVYSIRYWTNENELLHAFTYSFDTKFMVTPNHRGRLGSIVYWQDQAGFRGPLAQALMGYGPAASVESSVIAGKGAAVSAYGVGLDNNAISKLLWDFGLLGTIAFILIIAGAFFEALRLSCADWVSPWARWVLVSLKAWMLAFAVMLPYQVSVIGGAPMQFLFWFSIGLITYFGAWSSHAAPEATATVQRPL